MGKIIGAEASKLAKEFVTDAWSANPCYLMAMFLDPKTKNCCKGLLAIGYDSEILLARLRIFFSTHMIRIK
jgi:hypothetical protein